MIPNDKSYLIPLILRFVPTTESRVQLFLRKSLFGLSISSDLCKGFSVWIRAVSIAHSWHKANIYNDWTERLNSDHLIDLVLSTYLQHGAVIKVIGTGTPLQCWECHIAPSEGGDVTELIRTERLLLILSSPNKATIDFVIRAFTGATVILVGHPWAIFPGAFVNCKALWPTGMKLQTHVCDVEGFSCGWEKTDMRKTQTTSIKKNKKSCTAILSLEDTSPLVLSSRMSSVQ